MLLSLNCDLILESYGVILLWHMTSLNAIIAPFKCSKASFHFVASVTSIQLPKTIVSALYLNSMELDRWWENNFSCLNLDHKIINLKCHLIIWSLCTCTARIKSWVGYLFPKHPKLLTFSFVFNLRKLSNYLCSQPLSVNHLSQPLTSLPYQPIHDRDFCHSCF